MNKHVWLLTGILAILYGIARVENVRQRAEFKKLHGEAIAVATNALNQVDDGYRQNQRLYAAATNALQMAQSLEAQLRECQSNHGPESIPNR